MFEMSAERQIPSPTSSEYRISGGDSEGEVVMVSLDFAIGLLWS